ncbi:MAG: hypothetical protein IJZ15_03725 [Oscillospiraceae bacterium]|nr:hypothetical protein [Oscillospiraceae bacterium]
MKRWLGVLAIALLLCGCSNAAPQSNEDSETLPLPQLPEFITPALYDPQNPIESLTEGAVKAYLPENGECTYIAPVGKNIALFAGDHITLLRGERLTEVATAQIPDLPEPDSGMLQIGEDGIAYYDAQGSRIIFLNQFFREVGTFSLPEEIAGSVYIAPDWKMLYYCSGAGVHALDLDTGVSRLLKAQDADWLGIRGGFLNGNVLRCAIAQDDGTESTILLSAETGTVLAEGDYLAGLRGNGDCFYLQVEDDHVFGVLDEQTRNLQPAGTGELYPLPDGRGAVQLTALEAGSRLDYYDMDTGSRTASQELPGITKLDDVFWANDMVWFTSGETLYRWETAMSPVEDARTYFVPHFHDADPDEDGMAAIGQQLEKLEERFGVEFLYWDEVAGIAPWDYSFTAECLTEPYAANLYQLERVMTKFPEGFFRKVAQRTNSGKLNIALVRGIYGGVETEKYTPAPGMQFFANGDAYIALTLGEDLEGWFYHELGHLIDNRVLSTVNAYSQWSRLNPWDFKYDNDYIKNQDRTNTKYLEGERRHFVDFYSMSFAVEDRSRIFEYACMPGNEEVFASKYMQKKLKTVCDGIRQAFDLKDDGYIWEQYLQ